eukprot:PLAT13140.1.p1 GENE.PLAT13140.1~~PLAT13140.1.p1  ORF type:complete len:167 (-),score=78.21 PLAT13140.1:120-584(-)
MFARSLAPRLLLRTLSTSPALAVELPDVILTRAGAERLQAMAEEGESAPSLRLSVEGGGCSGFQYVFNIGHWEATAEDTVFEAHGGKLLVDDVSLEFLKGSTVDYEQELIRSGFVVVGNPQSEAGCGCGTSFALKEEQLDGLVDDDDDDDDDEP